MVKYFLMILVNNVRVQSYVFNPTINPDKSITFNEDDWFITLMLFLEYTVFTIRQRSAFDWSSFELNLIGSIP
ncbi:MAG: hypothetical protein FWE37_04860 [Spirochaetaceae bacterium]|nr:hypothetical protein [Spirochaetaceae bacterium]